MSYEIPGFDPTSKQDNPELPFSVWHTEINHIGLHVVHTQELYRRLAAGAKITLVDEEYDNKKNNIRRVVATAMGGENYDGKPADLYSATIDLRQEREWEDEFLRLTDHTNFTRLSKERFYWGNSRMLQRPDTNLIMQANIYSRSINLMNQRTSSNPDMPLRSTRLNAPARADVVVGKQLVHAFDCLTAMMCVAYSLGKEKPLSPGGSFIITPDGPLYKNPDTSDYVHRLQPEKITASGPKKVERKQGFDDLFGIDEIKESLRPLIIFYTRPELAAKWRVKRPGNVLLFGPAGTGKTATIEAFANEISADLHKISPADIYGKWLGDSEKAMQAIFDKVRNAKKPTVLLFDEMEGIVNIVETDASGSRATNAVAGIFKTESARVTEENPNVILAATTNDPDRLDAALIRAGRFDLQIAMGLPNDEARQRMFGNLILNYHTFDVDEFLPEGGKDEKGTSDFNPYGNDLLSTESLAVLSSMTDHDFSAADIIEVLRRAALTKADEEERTGKEPTPIDLNFLTTIITSMRRNRA
ncbi:MAG TPA: ATP-binding protein [Candidatus Saccharimonadales bacterium]|nr:ATP-binding protein [Candidatus Saccharimonadales bacterium]